MFTDDYELNLSNVNYIDVENKRGYYMPDDGFKNVALWSHLIK